MSVQPEFGETRTVPADEIASERRALEDRGYKLVENDEKKMVFVLPPSGRPGQVTLIVQEDIDPESHLNT